MKKSILIAVAFLSLTFTSTSFAWGVLGHRVVAEVAENHLTKKAQKAIQEILSNRSMAEVSNWMDDIKSDPNPDMDTLRDYHWVTIPDGMKYSETNLNPKGDVIAGIHIAVEKLKDDELSNEEKLVYLKMLIHFIGDIHQPLHVGKGDDAGGNAIRLRWFGSNTNLHRVWDSDMLDSKKYSYTELAAIVDNQSKEDVQKWQAHSIDDWVAENVALRDDIYNYGEGKYWEYKYMYTNWEHVKTQLQRGGIRLAGILNEIFG